MTAHRADPHVIPRRYGDDDTIGAANEINEDAVVAAARLVRHGRRYQLGQVLSPESPTQMWRYWKQTLLTDRVLPERSFGSNQQTFIEEAVSGALHSGTHLDGLAHIGIGEYTYNGHRYADIIGPGGVDLIGAENIPPFVTRGVLLDIARLRGVRMLGADEAVTADDLRDAEESVGVSVARGDVVLIHTGWGTLWDDDPAIYRASEPGIDVGAARWLADRRVSVIGADNWAVERVAVHLDDEAFPAHQECITRNGIYLLENVRATELAADGVVEFCCIIAPIKLKGATASMVGPVAVV
ncbi:MAG TPA: cyclase family protein [Streptosporangiaceae bacterium]|nr:cyclase family protein [Streptosporangiaceae bacterium]